MRCTNHRLSWWLVSAALLAAAASIGDLAPVTAADYGIRHLQTAFPDYVYDAYRGSSPSNTVSVVVDNRHRLVFEWDSYQYPCGVGSSTPTNFAAYDMDTMALRATGCLSPFDVGTTGTRSGADIAGDSVATVDERDGLLFFMGPSSVGAPGGILVYSETTLAKIASWSLPPATNGGPQVVSSLSWVSDADELLVLVDNGNPVEGHTEATTGPPQVGLYDYDVSKALRQAVQGVVPAPLWQDLTIKGCANALEGYWGPIKAYRSDASSQARAYVPCMVHPGDPHSQRTGLAPVDAIVSLPLARKDGGGVCADGSADGARLCPVMDSTGTVSQRSVVAPASGEDFFFDPQSQRGFMPCCLTGPVDLYVYDGPSNTFVGRTNVGPFNSANSIVLSFDTTTGRAYAFTPDGLTVVDLRRTPVPTGSVYPQLVTPYQGYTDMPVLSPSAAAPYPRLLIPHSSQRNGQAVTPYFDVYADTLPISQDPPSVLIDGNTYRGPMPNGQTPRALYSGNAAGYGLHSDLVGGPGGVISNFTLPTYPQNGSTGLPFADGRRDLYSAAVDRTYLSGASGTRPNSQVAATAFEPVDQGTAAYLSWCTDVWAVYGNCASPPCSYVALVNGAPCPSGIPISRQSTPPQAPPAESAQSWPFGAAMCSAPSADSPRTEASGIFTTGYSHDAQGNPIPAQSRVSGTENVADANTNCDSSAPVGGSATGDARLGTDLALSVGTTVGVRVASAYTSTDVSPPVGNQGSVSHVISRAKGVQISLPQGAGLAIADIEQEATAVAAGRAGTATASDKVTISHLVLTVNGASTELCSDTDANGQLGSCRGNMQRVIDAINANFPDRIHVAGAGAQDAPQPDSRYFVCPAGATLSGAQCAGSPGGYTAVVQASLGSQEGDRDFNQMTPTEAAFLPAMRLIAYYDGQQGLTREVLDFAGVEADAEYGIQPPDQGNCADCGTGGGTTGGIIDPGVLPTAGIYVPPPPPITRTIEVAGAQNGGGIVALVERVFAGVSWLFRNPWSALQMLLFLSLLLVPPVLMARRRSWLADMRGE